MCIFTWKDTTKIYALQDPVLKNNYFKTVIDGWMCLYLCAQVKSLEGYAYKGSISEILRVAIS